MNTSWKQWVFDKGEKLLKLRSTPLLIKETAWKAIRFASKCGPSHPISFALRPVASHKHLRKIIGLHLAIFVAAASFLSPIPSFASDTGGVPTVSVISTNEVKITTEEAVRFPLPFRDVSQTYWVFHPGMDFRAPIGTPMYPIMKGEVVEIEKNKFGYGNKIVIAHSNGYSSLYAHLSEFNVEMGDKVNTETMIGKVGSTGRSTGPHLHLEIKDEGGRSVNPILILGKD